MKERKAELADAFKYKEQVSQASAAWKIKDNRWKWANYGVAPPKPVKLISDYPSGNFMKFQAAYKKLMQ